MKTIREIANELGLMYRTAYLHMQKGLWPEPTRIAIKMRLYDEAAVEKIKANYEVRPQSTDTKKET